MATQHTMEKLSTALDARNRAELAVEVMLTAETARAHVRAENVLLDACIDAGMAWDYPNINEWAAQRVTRWLMAA
jgi:hypothetical protein